MGSKMMRRPSAVVVRHALCQRDHSQQHLLAVPPTMAPEHCPRCRHRRELHQSCIFDRPSWRDGRPSPPSENSALFAAAASALR